MKNFKLSSTHFIRGYIVALQRNILIFSRFFFTLLPAPKSAGFLRLISIKNNIFCCWGDVAKRAELIERNVWDILSADDNRMLYICQSFFSRSRRLFDEKGLKAAPLCCGTNWNVFQQQLVLSVYTIWHLRIVSVKFFFLSLLLVYFLCYLSIISGAILLSNRGIFSLTRRKY